MAMFDRETCLCLCVSVGSSSGVRLKPDATYRTAGPADAGHYLLEDYDRLYRCRRPPSTRARSHYLTAPRSRTPFIPNPGQERRAWCSFIRSRSIAASGTACRSAAPRAQVLAYDCRGHGRSDRRAVRFTAELFARDLAELLDHVGWPAAAIAGCSMGGCVALAFGGLYPDRAAALGLIDTTAWYGADAPLKFRERAEAARAKGMEGLIEFQLTRWFSDDFRAAHPDVLDRTAVSVRGQRLRLLCGKLRVCSATWTCAHICPRFGCRSRSSWARRITQRPLPWRSNCTRRFPTRH